MEKAYLLNNEIYYTTDIILDGQLIEERDFTDHEKKYLIWDGSSLVLDQAKIDAEIPKKKDQLINAIDSRTKELIRQGFTYNNVLFSLSDEAQQNLTGLVLKKDVISYPWPLSTKDNGTYDVADATEMDAIGMAALTVKAGHIQTGNAEKASVKAMSTLEELDAYVDNR